MLNQYREGVLEIVLDNQGLWCMCVCVCWEGRSLAGLQMLYRLNVGRICVSAVKYSYEQPVSS